MAATKCLFAAEDMLFVEQERILVQQEDVSPRLNKKTCLLAQQEARPLGREEEMSFLLFDKNTCLPVEQEDMPLSPC